MPIRLPTRLSTPLPTPRGRAVFLFMLAALATLATQGGCKRRRPPPPPQGRATPLVVAPTLASDAGVKGDEGAQAAYANAPTVAGPAVLNSFGGSFVVESGRSTKVSTGNLDNVVVLPTGVALASGSTLKDVRSPFKANTLGRVATGPHGELWALSFDGKVSRVSEEGKAQDSEAVPVPRGRAMSLAVAPDGEPVVATRDAVFVRKDAAWSELPLSKLVPRAYAIDGLVRYRDDVLVITTDGFTGVLGRVKKLSASGVTASAVHATVNGELAYHDTSAWHVLPADGGPAKSGSAKLAFASATRVTAFAVDGQGRRWIGTDAGVAVLAADGKPLHRWPLGTLPATVRSIHVLGAGPELPGDDEPIAKAPVQGIMMLRGEVAAGVSIVMCNQPSLVYSGSNPCSGRPVSYQAKTDSDGTFRFDDVLRGDYGLTYKDARGWVIASSSACCRDLEDGQTVNLGELRFKGTKP